MGALSKPVVLGVDWGTTHRRAYLLHADGQCIQEYADSDGALACKGRFPQALNSLLQHMQVPPDLVVMSGMVGSAFGWQEAPYVSDAVALDSLPQHGVNLKNSPVNVPCVLIPGYCVRNGQGKPDVMRGEETQLMGAVALGHHSGWFVLPGTHSKWALLATGRVVQLRTYMTGELFGLLTQHGTLAAAAGSAQPAWDATAFGQGVSDAGEGDLSHLLFGCRAQVVCGDMPASSAHAYLSGLLISSELHGVRVAAAQAQAASHFKLLGSPELATRYQAAALQLGLQVEVVDARAAFIAAMSHIQSVWSPT